MNQLVAEYTSTAHGTQATAVPVSQCATVAGASTPGAASTIAANGLGAIPQAAPAAVQEMIAAGNEITSYPYSYGGGHCVAAMQVPPGPSSCAGQWVTIYAGESGGQGHALIEVAGVVLDTVHGTSSTPPGTGPRWQPASEIAYELAHGSFVARHPPGL